LWFVTGPRTRKARNLAAHPTCTVSCRLPGIDVVLEGRAERVTDAGPLERLAAVYREAGWPAQVNGDAFIAPYSAPSAGPPPWHLYRVAIHTALASPPWSHTGLRAGGWATIHQSPPAWARWCKSRRSRCMRADVRQEEWQMPTFVTIGYGDRDGYDRTDQAVRDAAHAHDARLLGSGAVMGGAGAPVQVRNHDAAGVRTENGPFLQASLPVAGFALIEAASIDEAVAIVSQTPCAVAHGLIEVWPLEQTP